MESALARFKNILTRNLRGESVGVCSICSAHPYAIRAALAQSLKAEDIALVESTSNQVNQFGGYSGMRPRDFIGFVRETAAGMGFPEERLLFGGDHLGPFPWRDRPAAEALSRAAEMVREYVAAGYAKIHLDVSMHLGGDAQSGERALDPKIVAARTADLCAVAERAWRAAATGAERPVYIIGNEVPVPGGTSVDRGELAATAPDDLLESLEAMKQAFSDRGLSEAWGRIVAVVVQPGVEFGDGFVHDYEPAEAAGLVAVIPRLSGLVFEAHSTDYQLETNLARLVGDHFAILKVGPALTFAFREAVSALETIEGELMSAAASSERSNLLAIVREAMEKDDRHWRSYYKGNRDELDLELRYAYSDRIRYYWSTPEAKRALTRLLANLESREIPLSLLSQYLPLQYRRVREGSLRPTPDGLIMSHVMEVTESYARACGSAPRDAHGIQRESLR